MAKTAVQKRDSAPAPHVEVLTVAKGAMFPAGRLLIASPLEVQEVIRRIPAGRVLRVSDLRAALALKFRADYTCPLTTGIFLRIVAEATHEERGKAGPMVPYWRVVRDDGELIDKFPDGVEGHAAKLATDGVDVFHLNNRHVVGNVEHYAWIPPPQRRRNAAVAPAAGKGAPRSRR
jgi:alkylated DNA nucleotide flippase Atl1